MNFNKLIYLLLKTISVLIFIIYSLYYFEIVSILTLSLFLLLLQFLLVVQFKKFKPFALLLIYSATYNLVATLHFYNLNFPLQLGGHNDFATEFFYSRTLGILSIFWATVALVLPFNFKSIILKDFIKYENNQFVFYLLVVIEYFIIIFGRSGNNIFISGGYGSEDSIVSNLGGSSIFEYFLVIFPVSYIFTNNETFKKNVLLATALIFSIKSILLGGRIEFLQSLLLIFILQFDNSSLSLKKLFMYLILPICFLLFFGIVRSSPNSNYFSLISELLERDNLLAYLFLGNQIDVFYSSTRLFALTYLDIYNFWDRILIFYYNIVAIVTPYSLLPPIANLTFYKQDYYSAGGGGLFPVVFYVYLSFPGVVGIAFFLGLILKRIMRLGNKFHPNYFLIYVIMILATFPRWYAYSAIVFYKFCIYPIVLYFLIKKVLLYAHVKSNKSLNDNSN